MIVGKSQLLTIALINNIFLNELNSGKKLNVSDVILSDIITHLIMLGKAN